MRLQERETLGNVGASSSLEPELPAPRRPRCVWRKACRTFTSRTRTNVCLTLDVIMSINVALSLRRLFGSASARQGSRKVRKRAALQVVLRAWVNGEGTSSSRRQMYGAGTSMRNYLHSRRVVLLGGLLLSTLIPIVAKADGIVVLVDENGRKIYVNANESSSGVDWMTRGFRSNSSAVSGGIPANIDQLVEQTANRYQVDPKLVHAIIRVESDYDPKAVSSKGAMGLMQLIPATAQRFGVANPFDPKQNLDGGVNYLKHLLGLFQGDLNLSLAAYNAGEHSVQRYGGIPAIPETQKYVRKVTEIYQPGSTAMGKTPISAKTVSQEPPTSSIVRYVDERGVVHYTNVE